MKTFVVAGLLVLAGIWSARANELKQFELNGRDVLTVSVSPLLRIRLDASVAGQPAQLILSDTNDICELRMRLARTDTKLTDDQIRSQLTEAGKKLMAEVVEKEIKIRKVGGNAFTYFYFELTDSRPDPLKGSRHVMQGLGRSDSYVCEFVMLMHRKGSRS